METEAAEAEPTAKAVKLDDAKVPIQLWNDCVAHVLKNEWDFDRKRKRFV